MMNRKHYVLSFLAAVLLATPACYEDVPNLNGVDLDEIEENPTPERISELAAGLLIGHRAGKGNANGYVAQLGILGRESFNFDPADPRFRSELVEGQLDGGSPAFGGNFWTLPYINLRTAFTVLKILDSVPGMSDGEKNVARGFTQTIMALEYLQLINTRDENGIAIDVDRDVDEPLAPIVGKDEAFDEIERLLLTGCENLGGCPSGDVGPVETAPFTFALSNGFAGFSDVASFAQFNRAIAARVFAYREKWTDAQIALDQSFFDPADPALNDPARGLASLNVGAYHVYSTGSGDVTNALNSVNIYAQPAAIDAAEPGDARVARKLAHFSEFAPLRSAGSVQSGDNTYNSDFVFAEYQSATAPIAIIRHEELFLLQAEVHIGNGDLAAAKQTLDTVRRVSANLPPLADFADADAAIDALLHERRYSLLFEGGHRWLDMRRYGKLDDLLLDDQVPGMVNSAFPIPDAELNARE